jgi:hypothetical protein
MLMLSLLSVGAEFLDSLFSHASVTRFTAAMKLICRAELAAISI